MAFRRYLVAQAELFQNLQVNPTAGTCPCINDILRIAKESCNVCSLGQDREFDVRPPGNRKWHATEGAMTSTVRQPFFEQSRRIRRIGQGDIECLAVAMRFGIAGFRSMISDRGAPAAVSILGARRPMITLIAAGTKKRYSFDIMYRAPEGRHAGTLNLQDSGLRQHDLGGIFPLSVQV